MTPRPYRPVTIVVLCLLFLLAVMFTAPFIGSQSLDYGQVIRFLSGENTAHGLIFFRLRLPRVLLAVMVGASLSLAGAVFQALLRNPLATPYTLGVSTGGAVGALIVIKTGWMLSVTGLTGVQVAAFMGSLMTIGLVYTLSRHFGRLSVHSMILVGVTINYIFSAVILILHYLADFTETHQMIRWTIGGLDVVDYATLMRSLPVVGFSLLLFLGMSRALNILSTSEEMALSKGVNMGRVQKVAFLIASLLTGTVVSLTGPIGFVGLIIPHLLRLVLGPDHRYLLPAVFCFGGGFLALADTIARTIMAPLDLPVGIITTLIGGPFFLYLLIRRRA